MKDYYDRPLEAYLKGSGCAESVDYAAGKAAGLKVHYFKRSALLPRVGLVLGFLRGIEFDSLLDVGSGRGAFLWPFLDEFPEKETHVVDLLPQRTAIHRAVAAGGTYDLHVHEGDVRTLALPGTGKDTWILKNLPDVPMVSLDAIRTELGVSWEDEQGPVVALAFERAREHLRAHRSFVWNATCLTPDLRRREIQLFRDYGAYVEIVVLETSWKECLRRNCGRNAVVPEGVIDAMLGRFTPPSVREAQEVTYVHC